MSPNFVIKTCSDCLSEEDSTSKSPDFIFLKSIVHFQQRNIYAFELGKETFFSFPSSLLSTRNFGRRFGNSFDFKFSEVLESVCFTKELMRYKIRIRARMAQPTTEPNKEKQLLSLGIPSLSTCLVC
ncbi:hypothetical protein AVEN_260074-1 [Araneus ventricosus]|uniref:Uncharacterized protein n=1 Tax=Araneus ventricosus TaxID=182803 RepID=A0A4Y2G252_ARAVE|nr:hypothetical protein AVEN_260074-1 [Araneus ventricosus]